MAKAAQKSSKTSTPAPKRTAPAKSAANPTKATAQEKKEQSSTTKTASKASPAKKTPVVTKDSTAKKVAAKTTAEKTAVKKVAASKATQKSASAKTSASKKAAVSKAGKKPEASIALNDDERLPAKHVKIESVLITQPRPDSEKSPYFDLAKRYGLKLTFFPFVQVEGVDVREFRRQRVPIQEYTAVVLTSRNAVDHFFRICEEMKLKVSQDMKYFCSTEAVALYLQKFILYRKRKVFFSADGSTKGLLDVITKHKQEKFMVAVIEGGKDVIIQHLEKIGAKHAPIMLYRTVSNDITPAMKNRFDMIVFFTPFSVQTLASHDPNFRQNGTLIGAFGPSTSEAVENAGWRLDVKAPAPATPSMVAAMEQYLIASKKK